MIMLQNLQLKNKNKTVEGDNVLKAAAKAYRSKDTVDTSIDKTLADTVDGFFREGISDETYNELMISMVRPKNSLSRTRLNQLIWDQHQHCCKSIP